MIAERDIKRAGRAGYTLIELLVALGLLGLIGSGLFGSIQLGLRSWDRSDRKAEATEEMATVQRFLRHRLEEARPIYAGPSITTGRGSFEGQRDQMVFSTALPARIDSGGLFRLRLYEEPRGDGRALLVSWVRDRNGENDPGSLLDSPVFELLARARDIRFSYFGEAEGEGAPRWSEDWNGRDNLPELVRIDIEFGVGDPRWWPDLIVRTVVDRDANCVFDPVSKNCRGR